MSLQRVLEIEESGDVDACPVDLIWEEKQGVKEYIQAQTNANPYYALVTGALHGATVDYTTAQPFVDEIVSRGPSAWLDAKENRVFLSNARQTLGGLAEYPYAKQRSKPLAEISRCYVGNLDKGMGEKEAALDCAKLQSKQRIDGFGRKGTQLMREYLGDDEAVAVDRHVFTYVCLKYGICPPCEDNGDFGITIPDKSQMIIEDKIRLEARKCGKSPADVQVAAWLKGACDSRVKGAGKKTGDKIFLGEDKIVDCTLKAMDADVPIDTHWRQQMPDARKICSLPQKQAKLQKSREAGGLIVKRRRSKETGKLEVAHKQATLEREFGLY